MLCIDTIFKKKMIEDSEEEESFAAEVLSAVSNFAANSDFLNEENRIELKNLVALLLN